VTDPPRADSTPRRVRMRPGGGWATAAAAAVWLCALVVMGALAVLMPWTSAAALGVVVLVPSLLLLAWCVILTTRAASGFVLDTAGIHAAAQSPRFVPWADVVGLRWARTRWWGRGQHQLVADLRDARTIVVWGCRGPGAHDRIAAGLDCAVAEGLLPATVARAADLGQPWPVVAARLDLAAQA